MTNILKIRISVFILILGLTIAGCGTTHHFLPPRPLERKEWMLSVAWHYDLGRLTPPMVVPQFNAYVGIGKEYNFGFGAQPPFLVNHVTFARYYEAGADDRWSAYFHLNRVFNLNNNPEFELGGAYIDGHDTYDQQFMFGLSYGGCLNQRYTLYNPNDDSGASWNFRFMPVLKYTISGTDLGFSWNHYFGRTKTALSALKGEIISDNDTFSVFEAGRIDSIVLSNKSRNESDYRFLGCEKYLILYPDTGSAIEFCDARRIGDLIVPPYVELRYWLGKGYILSPGGRKNRLSMVLSPDSLKAARGRGEDLVITEYPKSLLKRIDNINGLVEDNSFGVGIINYQKPKD